MREGLLSPYNDGVSDATDPADDTEAGRAPVAPIPLPPDPLGRWLGPDHDTGAAEEDQATDDA